MTLKEIKDRTNVRRIGYGQYEVTVTFRGKTYKCKSNNSCAWDRMDDKDCSDRYMFCGYTNKGAWRAFYEECLWKNHIGKYNYEK